MTRSLPSGTPMIAAFTTTGDGTSSPMSRSMSAPSIRYGGDNTVSPSTSRYHATAASTSATHSAVCASPVITVPPRSAPQGRSIRAGLWYRPAAWTCTSPPTQERVPRRRARVAHRPARRSRSRSCAGAAVRATSTSASTSAGSGSRSSAATAGSGSGWPAEHGGRGATLVEQMIFYEEYARAGGPGRVGIVGEGLLGPTIVHFGSDAQQRRGAARASSRAPRSGARATPSPTRAPTSPT